MFPGPLPGTASATVNGGTFTLSNGALSTSWTVGATVTLNAFTNNAGAATPLTVASLYTLTLADGTTITPANSTLTTGPTLTTVAADPTSARLADRSAGKAVTTTYRYTDAGRVLDVEWTALLRDDANNLQHQFAIRAVTGTFDITSLRLVNFTANNARVLGGDDGSPIVLGPSGAETAFIGVENPMAKATVSDTNARITLARVGDLAQGQTWRYTASLGVSPAGQLRRSFAYYVQRERAHSRRTFLHYQSWLDLKPPSEVIDANELTSAINLFGTQLTDRGAKIDSFWVDDGWDYVRAPRVADESGLNVWSFDPTQFPNGFATQKAAAAKYGNASLSVWMSPFGGYDTSAASRQALNASKPADQRYETNDNGSFKLGGPRYYERFRSTAFNMMDNEGVRGFKFDGIGGGLYQTGPNPAYIADYEALQTLIGDLRAHQKDVWVNATVGTWGSPYWLWFADSIWRDGHDSGQTGSGTVSQMYVNYRDSETYRNEVVQNPLFPVPNVMTHGVIFSDRNAYQADYDLTKQSTKDEVGQDIKAYFALGLGLQELYVHNTLVRPEVPGAQWFWDTLAANAKWARANESLLTDVHWVGGDPALGNVYGTAAWTSTAGASKGMVMLRNPNPSPQTFTLNPRTALELPTGVNGTYRFTERDNTHPGFVANAATPATITLAPFEVAIFEATPTNTPPTGGDSPTIPRTGWTATTDSAETVNENGDPANAIDGNPTTIWHTKYDGGIDPMPHHLDINLGRDHIVDSVTYVPRQDGGANGNIAKYQIQTSMNGKTWTTIRTGRFTSGTNTVSFPPTAARYVRLVATSAQNGLGYAAAAEIVLTGRMM
ncbi:hypothetical protein GCM10029964_077750 [Kibdelosporangium lantanae]